jgi:hypothetical protein
MRRVIIPEPSTPPTKHRHAAVFMCEGAVWGVLHPATLETADGFGVPAGPAPRLIVRSERFTDDAEAAFAAWSGAGWRAFDERVARLVAESGVTPVVWPGPGSVLSDAVSTLSFVRKGTGVKVLADPVAWITPGMAKDAADHLGRFTQAMGMCEPDAIEGVMVRACPAAGLPAAEVGRILRPLVERVGTAVGLDSDLDMFKARFA